MYAQAYVISCPRHVIVRARRPAVCTLDPGGHDRDAPAELAGLRWSDIDFTRARLTPRLPRVAVNYQVHESDTKTPSGRRSLALDPATLEALGEHRQRQVEERAVIEFADTNDLVFTWPDGRPLHPDLITDWFQRHAKR